MMPTGLPRRRPAPLDVCDKARHRDRSKIKLHVPEQASRFNGLTATPAFGVFTAISDIALLFSP